MWCRGCKEAWNWRDREAKEGRAERVKYSTCEGRDAVIWKIKRNEKGEIFCLPYRTERKVPWWNWEGKIEWSVSRAQKGRCYETTGELGDL